MIVLSVTSWIFLIAAIAYFINRNRSTEKTCMTAVYRGKTYYRRYTLKVADIYGIATDIHGKYCIDCELQGTEARISLPIDEKTAVYVEDCLTESTVETGSPFCGINVLYMETEQGTYIKAMPYDMAFIPQDVRPKMPHPIVNAEKAAELNKKIKKDIHIELALMFISIVFVGINSVFSIIASILLLYLLLGTRKFSILQRSTQWCIIKTPKVMKNKTDDNSVGDNLPKGFDDWTIHGKFVFSLYEKYHVPYENEFVDAENKESVIETYSTVTTTPVPKQPHEPDVIKQKEEPLLQPITKDSDRQQDGGIKQQTHKQQTIAKKVSIEPKTIAVVEQREESRQIAANVAEEIEQGVLKSEKSAEEILDEKLNASDTIMPPTPVSALQAREIDSFTPSDIDMSELSSALEDENSRDDFEKELAGDTVQLSGENSFDPNSIDFQDDTPSFEIDDVSETDDISLAGEGMIEIADETPPPQDETSMMEPPVIEHELKITSKEIEADEQSFVEDEVSQNDELVLQEKPDFNIHKNKFEPELSHEALVIKQPTQKSLKDSFPHANRPSRQSRARPKNGTLSPQKQWKQWD